MNSKSSTVIGVVSDTHFWQRAEPVVTSEGAYQLQPWSEQLLNALINQLASAQVDLVVHLGDMTCGGGTYQMPQDEFRSALRYMHRRLHELRVPVVALPGNHDVAPGTNDLQEFSTLWHYVPGLGKTIDLPHVRLVLLNTMGHTEEQVNSAPDRDPVYGYVAQAELARLDSTLASSQGKPVMIFVHQLLRRWSGDHPWKDYYGILNASAVFDIIERHQGVCAVFQGHAHRLNLQTAPLGRGRQCVFGIVPAVIEYPVAWMRITLDGTQGRCELQRLPLHEIALVSELSGSGQTWRQGDPEWWDYRFPLC